MENDFLEIWADSFHEGTWCCDNISNYFEQNGYNIEKNFIMNFIPQYIITKDSFKLTLVVYGSYKSWTPIPKKIEELIEWGKPDFILYDPIKDEIVFAVEETAATPTGNQATQRCERQYGSARARIPYWYFISEFGMHNDGGVRKDSIWPTIAAVKLTMIRQVPCVVIHYSDENNVENYNFGEGMKELFSSLYKITENYYYNKDIYNDLEENLIRQYNKMLQYIISESPRMIDYLPNKDIISNPNTPKEIVKYALGKNKDNTLRDSLLVWPLVSGMPKGIINSQHGRELLKFDKLASLLENDCTKHYCYYLSNNAGSGKPPKRAQLEGWIREQKMLAKRAPIVNPPYTFNMTINDFPQTENGNYHITTSKNIIYLYDKWENLYNSIVKAYPRLHNKLNFLQSNTPVFLYMSNSIKPGRLFGDPFTGQLSAFSTIFGKFDIKPRIVVAYFPHQTFSQVLASNGQFARNKGMTLYTELTTIIIFNGGVVVNLKDGEII